MPQTMKLIGSKEKKITKDNNAEIVLELEVTEIVLVHCNLFNNACHNDSNKQIFLETFKTEFSHVNIWFADQNSVPLELRHNRFKFAILN